MFSGAVLAAPMLEYKSLDLESAERVTYLLQQSFRYEYPGPVEQLRQRLVVLPDTGERYFSLDEYFK